MGCGCGRGRKPTKSVVVNAVDPKKQSAGVRQVVTLTCQKCSKPMLLKQQYFPKERKYIKIWQCNKCGNKIVGK